MASNTDLFRELGSAVSNSIIQAEQAAAGRAYSGPLRPATRLRDYITVAFGVEPARHHEVWIEALQDATRERLLILTPPGHAKTTVAGIGYPSWRIGQDPTRHFLYYGNTDTQARKQSLAIRDITQTDVYKTVFPGVKRSAKGWAGNRWFLERPDIWDKDPTMLSLGVDGPALGSRADEFIFDDVCDPENMNTEESRRKVRSKIMSVAFTRQTGITKRTRMIAVMTRWHEDDLAKLFEEQGFEVIWMPALGYWEMVTVAPLGCNAAEDENHPHHHPPQTLAEIEALAEVHDLEQGEPLWPEEYPREFLEPFKASEESGDVWTLSYLGLAKKPGGNSFKAEQFRVWDNRPAALAEDPEELAVKHLNPNHVRGVFQFWDTASKDGKKNDFWAGTTWAWAVDGFYMLAAHSSKMQFPEGTKVIKYNGAERLFSVEWGEEAARQFGIRGLYIETTGTNNGEAVIQTLQSQRIAATGIPPATSKEDRAGKAMVWLEQKPFYIPADPARYEGWTESSAGKQPLSPQSFVSQFLAFPRGRHDDLVDSFSMALDFLFSYPVNAGDVWKNRLSVNGGLKKEGGVRNVPILVSRHNATGRRIVKGQFSGRRKNADTFAP